MNVITKNIIFSAVVMSTAVSAAFAQESKTYDISGFESIELNTSSNVDVTIGNDYSVVLKGDIDRIEKMELERSGDTLEINSKRRGGFFGFFSGGNDNGNLIIEITMPDIESMHINGSGNAEIKGVDNDELELQIHGSGDIYVWGKSEEVAIEIHGSGDIEMDEVSGNNVDVEIHGSGNVEFENGTCSRLDIKISGSGDVDAKDLICDEVNVEVEGSGNSSIYAKNLLTFDGEGSGSVDVFSEPKKVIDKSRRNSKIRIHD
ncbi:MAG: DUF2807 domain-containing protein [Emcibacteraceae bacterium]|nr:DUF2807 domain-containing protein [Emcibacteraceae bacterium]MDG1995220.1 DUF2807 domain-containing protein [Emcibacteraceae bacterium]